MTLRIVIVDDEPIARRGLRQLLGPGDAVVGEARNGPEAVRILEATLPDLVLLDVQIPEFDGFEVLRRLSSPLPAVIFVTAYDAYAVRAFETHALDYLVKPVHASRFTAAIERARERLRTDRVASASRDLVELLHRRGALAVGPEPAQRLVIPVNGGEVVLDVADITWIGADDYYAAVHTGGKRYLVRESLESLQRRLDATQFIRVHRSAIVNLRYVKEVRSRPAGSSLVLDGGARVPLSRRRREQVEAAIQRLARGRP
jgi:two-component system LytT family response regulator